MENDALVVYTYPVFHKQQDLNNRTLNQDIVENSTYPKASTLSGHTRWYYNQLGTTRIANPDYEFFEGGSLLSNIEALRREKGEFNSNTKFEPLKKLAKTIRSIVKIQSSDFRSTRFENLSQEMDGLMDFWDVTERNVQLSVKTAMVDILKKLHTTRCMAHTPLLDTTYTSR